MLDLVINVLFWSIPFAVPIVVLVVVHRQRQAMQRRHEQVRGRDRRIQEQK